MTRHQRSTPAQDASPSQAFQMQRWGGFWRRWAAYVVDNLITALIGLPIFVVLWFLARDTLGLSADSFYRTPLAIYFIVSTIYGGILIGGRGMATLGRSAAGLAVVDARSGERITGPRCYLRAFLSALFVLFAPIELLQLVTRRRQSLADLLCATVVVRTREHNRLVPVAMVLSVLLLLGTAAYFVNGFGNAGIQNDSDQSGEV